MIRSALRSNDTDVPSLTDALSSRCGTASNIGPPSDRALNRNIDDKLNVVRAVINEIAQTLKSASTIVLLADCSGIVIDQYGDESALERARQIHLSAGFNWSESSMGANGLGSALSVGGPVRVHGEEHASLNVRQWTCSGTLLSYPEACDVLGAICIASLDHGFAPFSIPLVVSVASQIQLAMLRTEPKSSSLDSHRIAPNPGSRHLIAHTSRQIRSQGLDSEKLTMIDAFIESHLNGPLDLQSLADIVGMSRFHFHRCFKLFTGETPHAYVLRLRLARACSLLAISSLSLTDISAHVGFADQSHFTLAFRQAMGVTPGLYRQRQQG